MSKLPPPAAILDEHHLILIIVVLIFIIVLLILGKGVTPLVVAWIRKIFGGGVTVNIGEHEVTSFSSNIKDVQELLPIIRNGVVPVIKAELEPIQAKLTASPCMTHPEFCPAHQAEHERSLRNEGDIKAQWQVINSLRGEIQDSRKEIIKEIRENRKLNKNGN